MVGAIRSGGNSMKRRRRLAASIVLATAAAAGASPAMAKPLPHGSSGWAEPGASQFDAWTMKRTGDHVRLIFSDVTYRGTVSGNVLRIRPNEGYGGVEYAKYRLHGKTLKIKWAGQSDWARFRRAW